MLCVVVGNKQKPISEYMAKLYSKEQLATDHEMLPKQETVDFILNYSKALKVIKTKNGTYESIAN